MTVEENLRRVRDEIANAAIQAGRDPKEVRLVAVTKTFPPEKILAAYGVGARDIGENRVEEASEKIAVVNSELTANDPITWHLIGHLQRRKVREAVALFNLIQSVDTVKLAQTLNRHARDVGKKLPILLQVNVARDPNKFGFNAESREIFFNDVREILALPALRVEGLMTIGPMVADPNEARPHFRALCELRNELAATFGTRAATWRELSMGMTDDFPIAIAEGATIVRIGRAIFGERAQ